MLIGNYSVKNKTPSRWTGGNSTAHASGICEGAVSKVLSSWDLTSDWKKFALQDRSGGTGIIYAYAGKPNGTYGEANYALPVKAGAISSHNYVNGSSTFVSSGAMGLNAEAPLSGTGNLITTNANMAINGVASLTGSGSFISNIIATIQANADLAGSGNISSATLNLVAQLVANLIGSGNLNTPAIVGILYAVANLTGSGNLNTPTIAGKLEAVATLTGSGNFTTSNLLAIGNIASDLTGSGNLEGSIQAVANMIAALLGSGSIESTATAKAFMSANINVTGDLLTTGNVADAVWAALASNYVDVNTMGGILQILDRADGVETDLTVRQALRLISATLAGKISGAPGTTITIRDINDTKNRVTATVDSNGNRTALTLDKD